MNISILHTIIQDGELIRTQIGINGWEDSVIISHNDNIIQINLVPVYYSMAVMSGDLIRCKYHFDGTEYLLEGQVEQITINEIPSMFIRVDNIRKFNNKRKNLRLDVRLGAAIRLKEYEEPTYYCIVNNLSTSGIGLLSKRSFDIGSSIIVEVLTNSENTITLRGQVIRQEKFEGRYEIGVGLGEKDKEARASLKKIIDNYYKFGERLIGDTIEKVNPNTLAKQNNQTVMIVEDSHFTRIIIKKLLSIQGFSKVIEVTDGPQALRLAGKLKPDIIILDIILPTVNGNEIIEEIHKSSSDSRIIVVSTVSSRKMIDEVKNKGVYEYIIKPFDHKELVEVVNRISRL